jgi:ribosomal protein S21
MLTAMIVNVGVTKNSSESTLSLLRRFTKRVQSAGIVRHVRGSRYFQRPPSKYTRRKKTLKRIEKRERYEELAKLGHAPVKKGKEVKRTPS